jgi:hypothetical protein
VSAPFQFITHNRFTSRRLTSVAAVIVIVSLIELRLSRFSGLFRKLPLTV